MFWHPHGDYLAVQVDRYTNTMKTTYTSFELFSVKGRDIPMEVLPGSSLNSVCLLSHELALLVRLLVKPFIVLNA